MISTGRHWSAAPLPWRLAFAIELAGYQEKSDEPMVIFSSIAAVRPLLFSPIPAVAMERRPARPTQVGIDSLEAGAQKFTGMERVRLK